MSTVESTGHDPGEDPRDEEGNFVIPSVPDDAPEQQRTVSSTVLFILQGILFLLVLVLTIAQVFRATEVRIDSTTVALLIILLGVTLLHRIQSINLGIGDTSIGVEILRRETSTVDGKLELLGMKRKAADIQRVSETITQDVVEVYDSVSDELSQSRGAALRELRRRIRHLLTDVCGATDLGRDVDTFREPDVRPDGGEQGPDFGAEWRERLLGTESESKAYGRGSTAPPREAGQEPDSNEIRNINAAELEAIYDVLSVVDMAIYADERGDIGSAEVRTILEQGIVTVTILQAERELSAKEVSETQEFEDADFEDVEEAEWSDDDVPETEEPEETGWVLSHSLRIIRDQLSEEGEITATRFATAILREHPAEYTGGLDQVPWGSLAGATGDPTRTVDEWLEDVQTLFEPGTILHSRLVVVGLSILDTTVRDLLQDEGILSKLEDEIDPPVETLLTDKGYRLRQSNQ